MKTIMWIIVVLIILGGGWWYFSMQPVAAPVVPTVPDTAAVPTTTNDATTTVATSTTAAPMTASVMYGAGGFIPATVTIAKGGTVTWVNQSGSAMWVASANHPSHTIYGGTTRQQHCPDTSGASFDQCEPGDNFSFTFQKTGSWGYHNHSKASDLGTVIVQ